MDVFSYLNERQWECEGVVTLVAGRTRPSQDAMEGRKKLSSRDPPSLEIESCILPRNG